jgi:hypothetical protein
VDTRLVASVLGWSATAVFVGSYFARPALLTRIQMAGALMWIAYGLLVRAAPVVAANVLVLAAAAWSQRPRTGSRPRASA